MASQGSPSIRRLSLFRSTGKHKTHLCVA